MGKRDSTAFPQNATLKVTDVGDGRKMGQNRRRRTRYAHHAAPAAALYISRREGARQRTRSDARAAAEGKLQCARDRDLGKRFSLSLSLSLSLCINAGKGEEEERERER